MYVFNIDPIFSNLPEEKKLRKLTIFKYIRENSEIINSSIFTSKSNIYFTFFIEIIKVELAISFGFESSFNFQRNNLLKSFSELEDIEDGLFINLYELQNLFSQLTGNHF